MSAASPLHWSARLVGWSAAELGGGPLPCWQLVRSYYASERDRMLPAEHAGGPWRFVPLGEEQEGDLLVFGYGGMDTHVAVVAALGVERLMLHLPEASAENALPMTVVERYDRDPFQRVLKGVYRLGEGPPDALPAVEIANAGDVVSLFGRAFVSGEVCHQVVPHGSTIAALVAALYPAASEAMRERMRVTVDGERKPFADWGEIPAPGAPVTVEPLPGVFGFRSLLQIGVTVAAIAASIALPPSAPAWLGPLLSTSVLFGGNLALNALLPPAAQADEETFGGQSPTYSITGWSNVANPNGAIPALLGAHRVAPVQWSGTFSRYQTTPVSFTDQGAWATSTAYALDDQVSQVFDFGEYGTYTFYYYCIQAHTSSASDEPGVGANWEDYWVEIGESIYSARQWNYFLGCGGFGPQEMSNFTIGPTPIFRPELFAAADGTAIGDMTANGGLAAAFDGETSETAANCASKSSATSAYIGKTFDTPLRVHKAVVYGSSSNGFVENINPEVTLNLRVKSGAAPSGATDGTLVGTLTFTDTNDESAGRTVTLSDDLFLLDRRDHMFVEIVQDGAANPMHCAELEPYRAASNLGDDIEIEARQGYDSDTPVTLYPEQVLEEALGLELPDGQDEVIVETIRTTARDVSKAELDFFFGQGLYRIKDDGTHVAAQVIVTIKYREAGTETWSSDITLNWVLQRETAFGHTEVVTFPSRSTYELSVVRSASIGPSVPDDIVYEQVSWVSLKSFRPEHPVAFDTPMALIAIKVRASNQLAGRVDQVTYDGRLICDDWDQASQTWIPRGTSNPASLCRWLLQGPAKAEPEPDSALDLAAFQDWHEKNDALGLEYNRVHDSFTDLTAALAQVARAGNAAVYDDGQQWTVAIDESQTVVTGLITVRNGWDIKTARRRDDLPDALLIPFRDKDANYGEAERVVPFPPEAGRYSTQAALFADLNWAAGVKAEVWDDPTEAKNGIYIKSGASGSGSWALYAIDLVERWTGKPGLTDRDAVWLAGRREQFRRLYRRRRITASKPSWQLMNEKPGNLVRVDRGRRSQSMVSALVRDVVGRMVWLDEEVEQEIGVSYELGWWSLPAEGSEDPDDPPGLFIVRPVVTTPGLSKAVTIAAGSVPAADDLAIFGPTGGAGFEAVVAGIDLGDGETGSIELYDHAPEIATLLAAEVAAGVPPFTGRVGEIAS